MAATLSANSRLAGRYAKALFEFAVEKNAIEAIEKDLLAVQHAIQSSEDLKVFLATPLLSRTEKTNAIASLLEKAGAQKATLAFAKLMAQNNRLGALPETIVAWLKLAAENRGEVTAEVTTAVTLRDAQKAAIAGALTAATGKKIKIEPSVDTSILGGVVVTIGSHMFDSSLRSKLERLKALNNTVSSLVA